MTQILGRTIPVDCTIFTAKFGTPSDAFQAAAEWLREQEDVPDCGPTVIGASFDYDLEGGDFIFELFTEAL